MDREPARSRPLSADLAAMCVCVGQGVAVATRG